MIIVKVEGSIEKALKIFKRKEKETQLVKQLRERQYHTSSSQKRRKLKAKAIYRQRLLKSLED